jgi:two-component system response regulator FixJ
VAFDGFAFLSDEIGVSPAMSENSTIFIVDDDEAVRDSLKLLLEAHGCRVRDYGSTREFVDNFRRDQKQCLVLDHHLPDQNGLDFLESDDGSNLQMPVIVVTGGGDATLRDRATRAGAHAYFDKPLNDTILLSTIFNLIKSQA